MEPRSPISKERPAKPAEAVFGIEYDKLDGEVKDYVDAMIADVKQIYTGLEFGSLEEFIAASRKGTVPKDTIKKVRDLLVEIRQTSKTLEIPQEGRERMNEKERRKQAQILWDLGFGKELGYPDFKSYLSDIPEIPDWPEDYPEYLDRTILVDGRVGFKKMLDLLGIKHVDYNDIDSADWHWVVYYKDTEDQTEEEEELEAARFEPGIYWMRCQDGKRYINKNGWEVRDEFNKNETGLTVFEGLALFAQDRESIKQFLKVRFSDSVGFHNHRECFFLTDYGRGEELDYGSDREKEDEITTPSRGK